MYSRISFVFQNGPTSNRRGKPKMMSPPANHRSSDGPTSNQRPVGFQLFRHFQEVGLYSVAFPGAFELWTRGYAACDWLRERPPSTHQPIITRCVGLCHSSELSTVCSDLIRDVGPYHRRQISESWLGDGGKASHLFRPRVPLLPVFCMQKTLDSKSKDQEAPVFRPV